MDAKALLEDARFIVPIIRINIGIVSDTLDLVKKVNDISFSFRVRI